MNTIPMMHRITYELNLDGTWTATVEWACPTSTANFSQSYLVNHRGEPLTNNSPAMQRTLNEICKDADYYYDDSVKLFNLVEEVKSGNLSESHAGFAVDYINEKIEALKDRIRKQRIMNRFEED